MYNFYCVNASHEHIQRHDHSAQGIWVPLQQFLQRARLDSLLPCFGVFDGLLHVLVAHTLIRINFSFQDVEGIQTDSPK
jgi:hypothetical protein